MNPDTQSSSGPAAEGAARADRWATAGVAAVFALLAAVYVARVPGVLSVNPDTAFYMTLGRSLARGDGYAFNFEPYAKYPPVYPLALAAVYATAGEDVWVMQALTALMGVGALGAAYALVKARAGRGPALGVAILAGTCSWFQVHAIVLLRADVPYAMLSLATLACAERRLRAPAWSWARWVGVVALATAALYTHLVGVALVAAVVAGTIFTKEQPHDPRRRVIAAFLVGAVAVAAFVYWLDRGSGIQNPMSNYAKHATLLPKGQMGETATAGQRALQRLHEWARAPLDLDEDNLPLPWAMVVLAALLGPGLVAGFWQRRTCTEFYLVAYFAVSTLAGGPTGNERYTIPLVPLLFYFGYASLTLWGRGIGRLLRAPRAARVLPRALVGLAAVAVLAHGIATHVRLRRGAAKLSALHRERDRRRVEVWRAAAARVRDITEQGKKLVYPGSGNTWAKLHYFTDLRLAVVGSAAELGPACLRSLLAQRAEFVFDDVTNPHSRRRLDPLLADHPQCFRRLAEWRDDENHLVLYRVDLHEVRKVLDARKGAPAS